MREGQSSKLGTAFEITKRRKWGLSWVKGNRGQCILESQKTLYVIRT